jgi:hypothetical protein
MRGDTFSLVNIKDSATKDVPQRINFEERKLISCVVQNTSRSAQTLWIGINDEQALLPVEPGESFPIAARENSYLRGFLALRWDNQVDDRYGIIVYGLDSGEVKEC